MTTATMPAAPTASAPPVARTVGRLAVRQVRRGTLIVAGVAAGMSALVAAQYQSTFSGELDQGALRALAENPAVRVLFGPPLALDDPGGFTVWRTGTPVLVIAAVWILLAVIRITRGEEEAGRWDLLLAGPLRTVDAAARCLLAAVGAAVVIGTAVGLAMVAAGTDPRGAALYAAGVAGTAAWFATVGALAAQAMPTRSAAVGASVAVLGAALLLRMLSDGVAALAWTAWLTPFGLLGRVAPYAHNDILPLLVLVAVPPLIGAAALATARHRDVGAGGERVDPSPAPDTPVGIGRRVRAPACAAPGPGLVDRDRDVLPATRRDAHLDSRVPHGEPTIRRTGRRGGLFGAGLGRRVRRGAVPSARHCHRPVRSDQAGRAGRRRGHAGGRRCSRHPCRGRASPRRRSG